MPKRKHQIVVPDPLSLYERCHEVGECFEWSGKYSSTGHAHVCVRVVNATRRQAIMTLVRPAMFQAVTGSTVPDGLSIHPRCRNPRCVHFDHFQLLSRKAIGMDAARRGAFSRPGRIAAITAGARRSRNAKLDETKAAQIRLSSVPCYILAEEYGVNKSLISRIKRGEAWRPVVRGASVFTWRKAA